MCRGELGGGGAEVHGATVDHVESGDRGRRRDHRATVRERLEHLDPRACTLAQRDDDHVGARVPGRQVGDRAREVHAVVTGEVGETVRRARRPRRRSPRGSGRGRTGSTSVDERAHGVDVGRVGEVADVEAAERARAARSPSPGRRTAFGSGVDGDPVAHAHRRRVDR